MMDWCLPLRSITAYPTESCLTPTTPLSPTICYLNFKAATTQGVMRFLPCGQVSTAPTTVLMTSRLRCGSYQIIRCMSPYSSR